MSLSHNPTQAELDAFIARAGFTYGWMNLESWARRMAEQAVSELAALKPEPRPEGEEPSELESVVACLGDDAATLLAENDESEIATNMQRAAELLESAAEVAKSLEEIIDLCAAGDVDESTDALGWGAAIAAAKIRLAKLKGGAA